MDVHVDDESSNMYYVVAYGAHETVLYTPPPKKNTNIRQLLQFSMAYEALYYISRESSTMRNVY